MAVSPIWDVIVVGLGVMGSAAVHQLSLAGAKVLGLDSFIPPHAQGSSHGESRIIREAYFEDPMYVPLVQRAYEKWSALESATGEQVYVATGGLMMGAPDSELITGTLASVKEHHLDHHVLTAGDIRSKYPVFQVSDEHMGVWEPRAGVLFPETAIRLQLSEAQRHGAHIQTQCPVLNWHCEPAGVQVKTSSGTYDTRKVVFAAGAWMKALLPFLPLEVTRQILFWFSPTEPDVFAPSDFPVYIWEYEPGQHFYGFPAFGNGAKVARHHKGLSALPDQLDREVKKTEIEDIQQLLQRYIPSMPGTLTQTAVCMYTHSPDSHFILDQHPDYPEQVWVLSPCSGHGFKFASAIGEWVAQQVLQGESELDLSRFGLRRFLVPTTHLY